MTKQGEKGVKNKATETSGDFFLFLTGQQFTLTFLSLRLSDESNDWSDLSLSCLWMSRYALLVLPL